MLECALSVPSESAIAKLYRLVRGQFWYSLKFWEIGCGVAVLANRCQDLIVSQIQLLVVLASIRHRTAALVLKIVRTSILKTAMLPVKLQVFRNQKASPASLKLSGALGKTKSLGEERGESKRRSCKDFYLLPVLPQYQGKRSYTLIWGASYFFLLGGLMGCGDLTKSSLNALNITSGIDVTPIRDLTPKQDNDATVYLQGKVAVEVPLLKQHVYQLQDSTGTIWILTNNTTPQIGDKVLIKGQVRYQSIPLAGKEFGEVYVKEQEQLERTPAQ